MLGAGSTGARRLELRSLYAAAGRMVADFSRAVVVMSCASVARILAPSGWEQESCRAGDNNRLTPAEAGLRQKEVPVGGMGALLRVKMMLRPGLGRGGVFGEREGGSEGERQVKPPLRVYRPGGESPEIAAGNTAGQAIWRGM